MAHTNAVSFLYASSLLLHTKTGSLELVKTTGGESALLGLLRVYKEFYPDIIIDQPVTGRIARFIVSNILQKEIF